MEYLQNDITVLLDTNQLTTIPDVVMMMMTGTLFCERHDP